MTAFTKILEHTATGHALSEGQAVEAMTLVMEGAASEEQMAQFLTDLARRGETVDEITGAARVLRAKAATIEGPAGIVDCCGTGGDGLQTYNISTAVALIAAASGVPVAKHGNRAASSRSGAADVLEALGVNLELSRPRTEEALRTLNFVFLMAPSHHKAMKHVVPVRKKLKTRTIFNLLGPLANPANTKRQLIGVFDEKWLIPVAETLKRLGAERAWVVHGQDGLDEISVTAPTQIVKLEDGEITECQISPADFGLPECKIEELTGGDAETNANALRFLLEGEHSAYRSIALANAAAVLVIADKANNLRQGVELATDTIDSGRAMSLLDEYRAFTQAASL